MSPVFWSGRFSMAVVVVVFSSSVAFGQTPIKTVDTNEIKTLERRLESFFTTLTSRSPNAGPDQAFRDLLTGGPLLANEQKLKEIVDSAKNLPDRYGEFINYEKVRQASVGEDVCVMTYLYKGKAYPVAWHFTFYRGETAFDKGTWACIGVRFDSKVEELAR